MTDVLQPKAKTNVVFGEFVFNPKTYRVEHSSGASMLLDMERRKIFACLAANKGVLVSKIDLYRVICNNHRHPPKPKIIDVQVFNLRKDLDNLYPRGGNHIITVWGRGYMLSEVSQERKKIFTGTRGVTPKILKQLDDVHRAASKKSK